MTALHVNRTHPLVGSNQDYSKRQLQSHQQRGMWSQLQRSVPVNETRAEVAALLFSDMGNFCPVSPFYVCVPLRLREIIAHRQDWLMEKNKTQQLVRKEEKSTLLGTPSSVFYPAAQREEVEVGCLQYRTQKQ